MRPAELAVINICTPSAEAAARGEHEPWCGRCGHIHPPRPVASRCRGCRKPFCSSDARWAYCTRDCKRFARKRQVMLATRRWRSSCR
jgi:hypothetical protein